MSQGEQVHDRTQVIRAYGATVSEISELLLYNTNCFQPPEEHWSYPCADEAFVETWKGYAAAVATEGTLLALSDKLPQLHFRVAEGTSARIDYTAATRQGVFPQSGESLQLVAPERCRLEMHATAAGHLPVITADHREDFVLLVQAFTKRNEPIPIPYSMGACLVSGYTNWDRVHTLRAAFEAMPSLESWPEAFARIKANKALYQDRFVLLSSEPYSGVDASTVNIAGPVWAKLSHTIRREHECTHYFTRRVLGSMRNNILDELIADYFGICAAIGFFRADWLLLFWGLHIYPDYKEGGRLQNYRGNPPLSDGAFVVLQGLAKKAAENLEAFDRTLVSGPRDVMENVRLLCSLTSFTIEQIASDTFPAMLNRALCLSNMSSGALL